MKIIFLDIDGVVCILSKMRESHRWSLKRRRAKKFTYNKYKFKWETTKLSSKVISTLNALVAETGAKVVISSAWRYGTTVKYFQRLFRSKGFVGEIIDRTPTWNKYKHLIPAKSTNDLIYFWEHERGNEINMWLNWNKTKHIESFVIIDDEISDIHPMFPDNIVHTNIDMGFRGNELLHEAIKILNK